LACLLPLTMATWKQTTAVASPEPAVALSFDAWHDLLWAGSPTGRVTSQFLRSDPALPRYTAYRGHIPGPVRDIIVEERGVLSVGDGSVKLANRRGLTLWNVASVTGTASPRSTLTDPFASATVSRAQQVPVTRPFERPRLQWEAPYRARRANPTSSFSTQALAPRFAGYVAPTTLGRYCLITSVQAECHLAISHLRSAHALCAGTTDGKIALLDPRRLNVEHEVTAHTGGLSALEAQGNLLLTLGYSIK
jgi:PAB-dependent poly(A)-specific ribonuclease subunit 2